MAEPVQLTSDALFAKIGRLQMEIEVRGQREEALMKLIQELQQAKSEEVVVEPTPPKGSRGR